MRISGNLKIYALASAMLICPFHNNVVKAERPNYASDTFEHEVTPHGDFNPSILEMAPSPNVNINGVSTNAVIVVDLSKNFLYKYDSEGKPEAVYLVSSGNRQNSPTHTGVRVVTHTETYPYKSAPASTKRRKSPNAYGPKIICLNVIDPRTGSQSPTGEFIHGTNQENKLGEYVSHGCIRMSNDVIKKLAKEVKRGDIVIII